MELIFERPHLYEKQFAAVYDPHTYSIIEASTKSGKTHGCLVWLIEQAFKGQKGNNFWWIAPVSSQADIAFDRAQGMIPNDLYTAGISRKTLNLVNGARLSFRSADHPDSLYGDDVYAAVIDEASRMKEDAFYAIETVLTATGGPLRIIGNVKGRSNWFYAMARRAEGNDPQMGHHRIEAQDAVDAGVLSAAVVEGKRRTLPEHIFRELYLAQASEDEGNPFGHKEIRACIGPMSQGEPVVWGWDLAKAVDWTVGIALDRDGKVCRFERFQQVPWEVTIRRIVQATARVRALVDSTGVGDPILESLQRAMYSKFEGFNFSSTSKQKLMEGLALAIQTKAVTYPAGPIVVELDEFTYENRRTGVRYEAREGCHDDCVCSLALAVWHFSLTKRDREYSSLRWVK